MTSLLLFILTQSCEARGEVEDEVRRKEEREEEGGDGAADEPPSKTATNDLCPHLQALTKQETDATADTAMACSSPSYGEDLSTHVCHTCA